MAGTFRVPRSRGALSGTLLILLGIWGALIPFVGPYVDYAYSPDRAWHYTAGRLILEILPGAGAILGGLLTLGSANRLVAMFGGWLAAVSGAWFVLGVPLSALWGSPTVGAPIGGTTRRAMEYVGFFGGLGAVIILLAAFALGRFAVIGVREARLAESTLAPEDRRGAAPPATSADTSAAAGTARTEPPTQEETAGHLHWPRKHAAVR